MGECNCQKKNSLLKNDEFKNYILILLILIIIGLFIVYKNCSR